ncbi:hypothetical protein BpHYR1_008488 [Brachionus plicatilis]|uniref:Uncharacterized protein n=1 Tax=Brachionus plicatilis TaxID=10195 RepID=A0A3M7RFV2_BRAPC|nr:hypothetical protein BpHYR1_008488 [Brachionus plicatilis]
MAAMRTSLMPSRLLDMEQAIEDTSSSFSALSRKICEYSSSCFWSPRLATSIKLSRGKLTSMNESLMWSMTALRSRRLKLRVSLVMSLVAVWM